MVGVNGLGESVVPALGNAKTLNVPADTAGNTPATSLNVGKMDGRRVFKGFVGDADTKDFFHFKMITKGTFTASLAPDLKDADITLFKYTPATGKVKQLATSQNSDLTVDMVQRVLPGGDYLVEVTQGNPRR